MSNTTVLHFEIVPSTCSIYNSFNTSSFLVWSIPVRLDVPSTNFLSTSVILAGTGARGSVVVEALCYKPERRGFEIR
jgi:hypothetical protein